MAELAVDLTYGTALIEAARETDQEERILEEGMQIADILKADTSWSTREERGGLKAS